MHYIQIKILDKLLYTSTLHYAQLRPKGIESNHFAYHLKQLMQDGFVSKVFAGVYTLAPAGLAYVDRLSHGHMVPREQPNIVTMIAIMNEHDQELLFQRNYQPFIGRWGYPSGKTHMGETVLQSAERELHEKTGLTGIELKQKGILYLETSQRGYTISKVLAHVFAGKVAECEILMSTSRGTNSWKDSSGCSPHELMPGLAEIQQLLGSSGFFFNELHVDLNSAPV